MSDAALASSGGKLVMATCYDERFPPENIIDGDERTFWMTTGLFPQEFVVELPQVTEVTRITTVSIHGEKAPLGSPRRISILVATTRDDAIRDDAFMLQLSIPPHTHLPTACAGRDKQSHISRA